LEFDLSEIPSQAFIHQAVLTLYVDQEQSQTDDEGMVISAAAVFEDSTWSPSTLRADSLNFIPQSVAVNSNQTIEFTDTQTIKNMTSIVQFWILETWPNNGLLIRSSEYGRNISSMSFYGLADTEKRPTLEIIYSLPASSRFEL
jgi:hypothetical protein